MPTGILTIHLEPIGAIADPTEFFRVAEAALNKELLAGGLFLESKLRKATPVGASGASGMRNAWSTRQLAFGQVGISNSKEYFLPVEAGRRAAPVPIAPLELWVRRKLGIPRPRSFRVAHAISYIKSKQRTPGQFFAKKAINQAIPQLEKVLLQKLSVRLQLEWSRLRPAGGGV